MDGHRPRDQAAGQPPRRHLPGRPLQRQQRPGRRLRDQRAHHGPRRLDRRPHERHRVQRGLPLRLQPRRRRRDARASPCRSTGRRPSPRSARRSSPAPATSTATPTSSSTASGSTATSPASCAPARPGRRLGRRGAGPGQADLPRDDPDIRGIHEKAILEATLFGLPMLGVDDAGRPWRHAGHRRPDHPDRVADGPGAASGWRPRPARSLRPPC